MYSWLKTILICTLLCLAANLTVADDVELDKTFGDDGVVITKLGFQLDEATSIAVQDDGKIVVAGTSDNGLGSKMAVVRYFLDGSVDHEFQFSSGAALGTLYADDAVHGVTFGDNGTILLGGTLTIEGVRKGSVVRLLENGQLDSHFGDEGVASLELDDGETEFMAIGMDEAGRIIATGFIDNSQEETVLLARFDEDGFLDPDFSEDGVATDSSVKGRGTGLAESADGKIVVCGFTVNSEGWKGLYLARYQENGEQDTPFGDKGTTIFFDDAEQVVAHDIALAFEDRIVLAGQVVLEDGQNRIMLGRYEEDGSPDNMFADNGILVHDLGIDSSVHSMIVHEDKTIIAAGYQESSAGKDVIIISYQPQEIPEGDEDDGEQETEAGSLDTETVETINISTLSVEDGSLDIDVAAKSTESYEADLITTEIAGSDEVGNDLLVTDEGDIYTAGSSGDEDDSAFMVARYSGVVGDEESGDSGENVSEFFRITTTPVTDVTRVGWTSGGNIVELESDGKSCATECYEACADVTDVTTCEAECDTNCVIATIVQRGVVYSVDPDPEYDDGTDTDDEDDSDDDTETILSTDDDDTDTGSLAGMDAFFSFEDYFVKSGQSDDGDGSGTWVSTIEDVNPQTVYYIRAYGLLSDGSVIYGDQYTVRTRDSCFIATAAFGSIDMVAVRLLRQFRDDYLVDNEWGRSLVNMYYYLSPTIADLVEQSYFLRILVIILLIPAVAGALFMLYTTLLVKGLILLSAGVWCCQIFFKKHYGILHE